ncbi:MAG: GDPmannose 4,6-dehydratase [Candidatus Deianiraeaceae bacterium]|jgi:GDPmannose 4,6-dehydratase
MIFLDLKCFSLCSVLKKYSMKKVALITGITGQDGSYLVELLLSKGYEVHGVITKVKPDEFYNLVAQSHVRVAFDIPEYTTNATALGTCKVLEAIRSINTKIKYYQASSSGMFACNGILFNHELPRRGGDICNA